MKIGLVVGILVVVIGGYFFGIKPYLDSRTIPVAVVERVAPVDARISFEYRGGADAYALLESNATSSGEIALVPTYVIMETQAYNTWSADETAATPPSMSVVVFDKPDLATSTRALEKREQLIEWANKFVELTNISAANTPIESAVIDGIDGIYYHTRGAYEADVYIMDYRGRYYLIVGQYRDEADSMKADFTTFIDSIHFE